MQIPTAEELVIAHEVFERKESRKETYWTAITGVENGLHTQKFGEVASSVAEFLKSWNRDGPQDKSSARPPTFSRA